MPKNLLGFTVLGGLVGAAFFFGDKPNAPIRRALPATLTGAAVGAVGAFTVSFLRAEGAAEASAFNSGRRGGSRRNLGGVPVGKRIPLATAPRRK